MTARARLVVLATLLVEYRIPPRSRPITAADVQDRHGCGACGRVSARRGSSRYGPARSRLRAARQQRRPAARERRSDVPSDRPHAGRRPELEPPWSMGLRSTAVKGHRRHPGGGWTGDEGPSTQRSHSAAGHRYSRSTGVADATRVVAGSHATTADQRHGCRLRHTWCRAPASRGSIEAACGDRQDERCRHHQLDRRGSGQSHRGAFWRTLARGRDGNGRRQRGGAARIPVRVDGLLLADAPVLDSVRAPALRQLLRRTRS